MPSMKILNSGVSALKSFEQGIRVVGNNIANVNSTAYKKDRLEYTEHFSDTLLRSKATGITRQAGSGVQVSDMTTNFSQGTIIETGYSTDIAINGAGYFLVRDTFDNASYATRAGSFQVDANNNLITSTGMRVQGLTGGTVSYDATVGTGGELVLTPVKTAPATVGDIVMDKSTPGFTNNTGGAFTNQEVQDAMPTITSDFSISPDGFIEFVLNDGSSFEVGRILLTDFNSPNNLINKGFGLYGNLEGAGMVNSGNLDAANNAPGSSRYGTLDGGRLEISNVDLTEEFANLISIQRSFQAGARIITTADELMQEVVNLKR